MTATTNVYVVERDPSARVGLVRLLRRAGHDALGFPSVPEFLEALDPERPGCLVLDSETVGSAGEELKAGLKASGAHLPVIMISAEVDDLTWSTALGLNAAGLYRKPVDGPALLDAVKWALEVAENADGGTLTLS